MNQLLKKILIRFVLLIAIAVLSNFLYVNTTYKKDISTYSPLWMKFENAAMQADALYFSSSPNAAYSDELDLDTRPISRMVDYGLPEMKVMSVDTGAIHAGIFKKLIRRIPEESDVNTVIVHVNYRSFGTFWINSSLENSVQQQSVFYNPYPAIMNRYLLGLNAFEIKSQKERDRLIEEDWENDLLPFDPPRNKVETWCAMDKWDGYTDPRRGLADNYIKSYAFTLNEDNPRVRDFDEIVAICKEKELRLIMVILPENLEYCEYLVGPELPELMTNNKNWLVDRYKDDAIVLDNFNTLADSSFLERDFPSEHYFDEGRQAIAHSIIEQLKN